MAGRFSGGAGAPRVEKKLGVRRGMRRPAAHGRTRGPGLRMPRSRPVRGDRDLLSSPSSMLGPRGNRAAGCWRAKTRRRMSQAVGRRAAPSRAAPTPPAPQLTLDGRPRVYRDPTSGPSSRQAAWQGASAQLAIAPRRTMSRAASPIPLTHHPRVPCRPRRWRPGPKWPGWRGLPSSWAVADSGGSSCEVALARPAPGCARAQLRQGWAAAPLAVATAPPWPLLLSHTRTPKPTPTHTNTHRQHTSACRFARRFNPVPTP